MKRWQQLTLTLTLFAGVSAAVVPTGNAAAINVLKDQCTAAYAASPICDAAKKDNSSDMIKIIINTMLYIIGILAVIMIVLGGIRYTVSNGDASKVKAAKDTITYAVIGLVVALLAFTIVNFVVGRF